MEKWKAKNASHFPTPPTTATGRYLTLPLRYTNNLDGTNYRAGHSQSPTFPHFPELSRPINYAL
jgi:hypothetical protein